MKNIVKIGIDYHGVITADPEFFAKFTKIAAKKGIQIYVLSGGGSDHIKAYLQAHNICYDKIFSMLDYFENMQKVEYFVDGSFKVDDELWNKAKADYCIKEGIDFHIDDSNVYGAYFTTPFCLFDSLNKKCLTSHQVIDFTKEADQVLENILHVIS